MNSSSNRLSIKADLPLAPLTAAVLLQMDILLRRGHVRYMLVGATARDLLLHHVWGYAITRATRDLDFAFMVESWARFHDVKRMLLATPGFLDKGRQVQRLYYKPPGFDVEAIIDILPFAGLATNGETIAWPPDQDVVMNVAAFTDVLAHAVDVQIAETTWIPAASLAGLAVLKLFAWLDRRDPRDAADLQRLMETYADAGNTDRLYESEGEELERVGYDMELAGAYLLGRDAHSLTNEANRARLAEALSEPMIDSLVLAMTRMRGSLEDHTQYSAALLSGFLRGFNPLPDVGDR
jgi:predicted nucleotidyltransferase